MGCRKKLIGITDLSSAPLSLHTGITSENLLYQQMEKEKERERLLSIKTQKMAESGEVVCS